MIIFINSLQLQIQLLPQSDYVITLLGIVYIPESTLIMVGFLDAKHHHIDRNKLFSRFLKWYPMLPPTNQRQSPIRDLKDYKGLDNMIPVIAKMVMVLKGSKISYH